MTDLISCNACNMPMPSQNLSLLISFHLQRHLVASLHRFRNGLFQDHLYIARHSTCNTLEWVHCGDTVYLVTEITAAIRSSSYTLTQSIQLPNGSFPLDDLTPLMVIVHFSQPICCSSPGHFFIGMPPAYPPLHLDYNNAISNIRSLMELIPTVAINQGVLVDGPDDGLLLEFTLPDLVIGNACESYLLIHQLLLMFSKSIIYSTTEGC
jgi:hypothetical protein